MILLSQLWSITQGDLERPPWPLQWLPESSPGALCRRCGAAAVRQGDLMVLHV